MRSFILILIAVVMVAFTACSPKSNTVSYTEVQKYFVKNTFTGNELSNPLITTQAQFDAIFGAGATMGENGKPTALDFNKQNVIAVIKNSSDLATNLKVISLVEQEKGLLILTIKTTEGEKQSFTTRPVLLIAIDKKYNGQVTIKEQS